MWAQDDIWDALYKLTPNVVVFATALQHHICSNVPCTHVKGETDRRWKHCQTARQAAVGHQWLIYVQQKEAEDVGVGLSCSWPLLISSPLVFSCVILCALPPWLSLENTSWRLRKTMSSFWKPLVQTFPSLCTCHKKDGCDFLSPQQDFSAPRQTTKW